jgi:hypothetical protein
LPQAELTKRRSRSESRKSSDHRPGVSLLALWLLSFLNCQLRQSLAPLPNQRAADEGDAQSDKHNREAIKRSNTNTVDQSCRDFLRLQPDLDQSTSAARFIAGESAFLWLARSFRAPIRLQVSIGLAKRRPFFTVTGPTFYPVLVSLPTPARRLARL